MHERVLAWDTVGPVRQVLVIELGKLAITCECEQRELFTGRLSAGKRQPLSTGTAVYLTTHPGSSGSPRRPDVSRGRAGPVGAQFEGSRRGIIVSLLTNDSLSPCGRAGEG